MTAKKRMAVSGGQGEKNADPKLKARYCVAKTPWKAPGQGVSGGGKLRIDSNRFFFLLLPVVLRKARH